MRSILLAATLAWGAMGVAKADPIGEGLVQKAEACIRANAPRAAALAPGLTEPVAFLIDDLCAVQIQHADAYDNSVRLLAAFRVRPVRPNIEPDVGGEPPSMFDRREQQEVADAAANHALLDQVTINPDTGELIAPTGFEPPIESSLALRNLSTLYGHPHYRAVAAEAVLAARESVFHN